MKRVLIAFVLVANPLMPSAQSDAERIAEATAALPEHLRAGARVVFTDTGGIKRVLSPGSNGFVCGSDHRSEDPAPRFKVACLDASLARYFDDVGQVLAKASSASEHPALIDAAIEEGLTTAPTPGSRAYILSGPDRERARPLLGIFLPGATAKSTGLSTERTDGTWLMCPGTPSAHIMVGDVPYGDDEDYWKSCGR